MYDYVLQYGFDNNTEKYVENIKKYLKENNIEDKERNWAPHITIDLYNCKTQEEFIKKVDNVVYNVKKIIIECKNLNDFDEKTLYIEPFNKEKLMELKLSFDNELNDYRLENRRKRIYKPHITLCTNDNIDDNLYNLAYKKFNPFIAEIRYVWIYTQDMKLIKQYELK